MGYKKELTKEVLRQELINRKINKQKRIHYLIQKRRLERMHPNTSKSMSMRHIFTTITSLINFCYQKTSQNKLNLIKYR